MIDEPAARPDEGLPCAGRTEALVPLDGARSCICFGSLKGCRSVSSVRTQAPQQVQTNSSRFASISNTATCSHSAQVIGSVNVACDRLRDCDASSAAVDMGFSAVTMSPALLEVGEAEMRTDPAGETELPLDVERCSAMSPRCVMRCVGSPTSIAAIHATATPPPMIGSTRGRPRSAEPLVNFKLGMIAHANCDRAGPHLNVQLIAKIRQKDARS